ncbi:helix-turn-helix domain-containing protein [Flagellimonas sp.]|uniref:AlbA family DNA-binding domain-containing protein n=1 Tax=Flagellimonas sp. TaxID=2058762 RepID=UPI003BAF99D0
MEAWTLEKIVQYIDNQIEESNSLDYKAAGALANNDKKKNEISKDVSAFANSNGGVIIYGVKEFDDSDKNHLPERIDPVERSRISKEWLEQVIATRIQPKIEGTEICPVTVSETENTVIYVVNIPKSSTAHQASDNKYYKRYNFQSEPMQDYEIRDVMNRASYPKIELEFEIETRHLESNPAPDWFGTTVIPQSNTTSVLKIYAKNNGNIYANYVNYYVFINRHFLKSEGTEHLKTFKQGGYDMVEYYGENTVRDVIGMRTSGIGYTAEYGPSRFDPILPGMHSRPEELKLIADISGFKDSYITWKVFADNAMPSKGKVQVKNIPITYIEEKTTES